MAFKSSLIATVVIRIAPNLIDEIICQLRDDRLSLTRCSLVSKDWRTCALKWLFATIVVEIAAWNPWVYHRRFGELAPGFHLATTHAHELRLVQYPSFIWIKPSMLEPILPQFARFKSVTILSLHSFSVHHFSDFETRSILGHFFPTVRKLNLEDPRATARGLLRFICNFKALDDLRISGPEWDHESKVLPASELGTPPPLHGTLHLQSLHVDSVDFFTLLTGLPIAFRCVSLANCQLPSILTNSLLRRLTPSLKTLSVSSWTNADCFRNIVIPPRSVIEEIKFFVGVVPESQPLSWIFRMLDPASMRCVRMISLGLIAGHARDTSSKEYLQDFEELNTVLHRIASVYNGVFEPISSPNDSRTTPPSSQLAWDPHPWRSTQRSIRFTDRSCSFSGSA